MNFFDFIKDIWDFLKVRKKYWLAPLILTLIIMGTLIFFTQGSIVAPFIYSIF
tara:strand:+ start:256 stop:414 length:159 start_codon:yes stop_codon:yes gene_type:complete